MLPLTSSFSEGDVIPIPTLFPAEAFKIKSELLYNSNSLPETSLVAKTPRVTPLLFSTMLVPLPALLEFTWLVSPS